MDSFESVIILGAARSGTNMLRDILEGFPEVSTWDCDEINPIWRHGNLSLKHDEFSSDLATDPVKKFIRKEFKKIATKNDSRIVVEKTCANTLRVPFINAIFPEAKYLVISRNGYDTTASSMLRWEAPFDLNYTLKKAKYIPYRDIPYYLMTYGLNRIRQLLSSEKRLSYWGLRLKNMDDLLNKYSLCEICALQWKYAVESVERDLKGIDQESILRISYEEFALNPQFELEKILQFLNIHIETTGMKEAIKNVNAQSIGKYKNQLSKEQISKVGALIDNRICGNDC